MVKVFKFGGASVKDADAVRNVVSILQNHNDSHLVVVVSAMGKTTNALERLTKAYFFGEGDAQKELQGLRDFHEGILNELFPDKKHAIYNEIYNTFVEIEWTIDGQPEHSYDHEYDQIVAIGEMLSTKIVSAYLQEQGVSNQWMDVRDMVRTDSTYREGKVDWEFTGEAIRTQVGKYFDGDGKIIVTQGFVGATDENYTTTLGREGSDYTAAIFAYSLDAAEVTIWKDVPGMLNADPKWFDETELLKQISYREAIELSYYGATVIHPKTIKPLQNKGISLRVKSFKQPELEGSVIHQSTDFDDQVPSFIFKVDQVLISLSPKDFSFIIEENLSDIFGVFSKHKVKINLMQNSAINFSVCVDSDPKRLPGLMEELKQQYRLLYNEGLELVTIRHYDQQTIDRVLVEKEMLLKQETRNTARYVVKPLAQA